MIDTRSTPEIIPLYGTGGAMVTKIPAEYAEKHC
jgi:hypothetical protein